MPLLSAPSLKQQMAGHRSANMTLEQLEALSAEQKGSYYDARGGRLYPSGRGLRLSAGAPAVLAERQGAAYQRLPHPLRAHRAEDGGLPQPRGSWACRWWASIRRWCSVTAMSTSRRSATSAAISVLLVHEWLPKALTSDARPDLGGEPVPVRSLYRSDRATGGDKAVGRYFCPLRREAGKRQRWVLRDGWHLWS